MTRTGKFWNEIRKPQTVVSLLAAVLAGFSLWVSYSIYENQITHYAWGRLSTHIPGNSGISGALNFLHERREDLRFIDLRPFGQAYAADDLKEGYTEKGEDKNFAYIVKANMDDANLSGAWLNETHFIESTFVKAILTDARADKAVFKDSDFTDATLEDGQFSKAQFVNVNFTDANLVKGHFSESLLEWVTAVNMNAEEIDLSRATGTGTRFDGASMVSARLVDFAGQYGSYKDVNLSKAYLMEGNFSYSTLQKADLSGSYLFGTNFDHTNLSWVDFSNARGIKTATFVGAWVWDDAVPKNLDAKVEEKIAKYKQECRKGWEGRVSREYRRVSREYKSRVSKEYESLEESSWIKIYRPPDDEACVSPT